MTEERKKARDEMKNLLKNCLGKDFDVHFFDQEEAKKKEEQLKKELPYGDQPGIPKKNAWIVWRCDENQHIIDMQVYELDDNLPHRWEKIVEHVERHCRENKITYKDCGCVTSGWNEWKLQDILFKFGCQYGFLTRNIMVRCLERLASIEEFEKEINGYLQIIRG